MTPATPSLRPRVLVVDDDPLIGRVALRALQREGFEAEVCMGDVQARAAMATEPERIDVLVIDLRLGRAWGPRLAAELRELRPGLPVVLATGDPRGPEICADMPGPVRFLAKPFRGTVLARCVRQLLSEVRDGGLEAGS